MEWNGAWSDTVESQKTYWDDKARKHLNYIPTDNDGVFWMAFEDF